MIQDGLLDTARVLLVLYLLPEYKSILAGREEGVRVAVYLPDFTVEEVHTEVGRASSMRLTNCSHTFPLQLVAVTGGDWWCLTGCSSSSQQSAVSSQASLLREHLSSQISVAAPCCPLTN